MSFSTVFQLAVALCAVGWTAQLIANGVRSARGLVFDSSGALLVAQANTGITRITFTESGNCLSVASKTTLATKNDLTHGIALSGNGTTLYASSAEAVFAWQYSPSTGTVTGSPTTIISGMNHADHVSRTLTMSKKQPNQLIVSRGSNANLDTGTKDINSGRSMIKAFDLAALPSGRAYTYSNEGRVLGWGLRNDVGVAEHPTTGGIWSVENSVDMLTRNGVDIHTDNPGEELNYLGALSDPVPAAPPNFGYPDCVALYKATGVPNSQNLQTGVQFSSTQSTSANDTSCASSFVAPRLTFESHMAPLDIAFTADGSEALIPFHGSWNRQPAIGYKLGIVSCFRPVGVAIDAKGRVFMSSDTTGEIYVLQRPAAQRGYA
ncbi:putative glucose sorbosone dehydrogenase [Diaporthe ampelina]|uniref:Putative glucose sorbosone dehydrogenase n=1 Tax=Diaporthe ampelina TaxID=1214573 RepID=A0A0G2FPB1_9PEZI|nr:putative glucose sorbosone dehydrogenase [Diaporthe ampelina]